MGIYDEVRLDFRCPECGHVDEDHLWQTKALRRLLDTYEVGDEIKKKNLNIEEGSIEIHTVCPGCDNYVKGFIRIEEGRLTDEIKDLSVK